MLSLLSFACDGNSPSGDDKVSYENSVAVSKKTTQTTPMGAKINSLNSPTPEFINQVDKGILMAITNARISGYTLGLSHSQYNVYIPYKPCVLSPEQQIPSFKIETGNYNVYNGSIYDQHNTKGLETDPQRISLGYKWKADDKTVLLAAEMVFTMTETMMEMIVCPGSEAVNGNNNGAEHYIIRLNDYPYYEQTEAHLIKPHPLLPKSSVNKSVRSTKPLLGNEVIIRPVK